MRKTYVDSYRRGEKNMNIKANRLKLGYTIDEIAEYVDVTKRTIINWEKEETEPNEKQYKKLNDILALEKDDIPVLAEDCMIESKNTVFYPGLGNGSLNVFEDMLINLAAKENHIIHIGAFKGSEHMKYLEAAYISLNLPYSVFNYSEYQDNKFNPSLREDFVSIAKKVEPSLPEETIQDVYEHRLNEHYFSVLLPVKEASDRYSMLEDTTNFAKELIENKTLFIDLYENNVDYKKELSKTPVYTKWLMQSIYNDIAKVGNTVGKIFVCIWDYDLFNKFTDIKKILEIPSAVSFVIVNENKKKIANLPDLTCIKADVDFENRNNSKRNLYVEKPNGEKTVLRYYFGSRYPGLTEKINNELNTFPEWIAGATIEKNLYYASNVLKIFSKHSLTEKERHILTSIILTKPDNVKDGLSYIDNFLDKLVSKEHLEEERAIKIAKKFTYRSCKTLVTLFSSLSTPTRNLAIERKQLELLFDDFPEKEIFPEDNYGWEEWLEKNNLIEY